MSSRRYLHCEGARRVLLREHFEPRLCLAAVVLVDQSYTLDTGDACSFEHLFVVRDAAQAGPQVLIGGRCHEDAEDFAAFQLHRIIDGTVTTERIGHTQRLVLRNSGRVSALALADLDGDGDDDLVVGEANIFQGAVSWFENTDGFDTLGQANVVFNDRASNEPGRFSMGSVRTIDAKDIDGDGDLDLIASSNYVEHTVWFENDGQGNFEVGREFDLYYPVVVDMDGDGDLDVVGTLASGYDDAAFVFWIENIDEWSDLNRRPLSVGGELTKGVRRVDIDGNGTTDIAVWTYGRPQILWLEIAGSGVYLSQPGRGSESDDGFIDFDGDGDVDLISVRDGQPGRYGQPSVLRWALNEDGLELSDVENRGVWTAQSGEWAGPADCFSHLYPTDVDSDNDVDLAVLESKCLDEQIAIIRILENRLIGDANDDGIFDSADLVNVVVAGEYEDGIPGNSTFDEGDWNQDGDFGTSDLVFALQSGNYVTAANPAADRAVASDAMMPDEDVKTERTFVA